MADNLVQIAGIFRAALGCDPQIAASLAAEVDDATAVILRSLDLDHPQAGEAVAETLFAFRVKRAFGPLAQAAGIAGRTLQAADDERETNLRRLSVRSQLRVVGGVED